MFVLRYLFVSLGVLIFAPVCAQDWVQTGRYASVATIPTPAQQAPLDAIISIEFPEPVSTVGAAIQMLVDGSGYELSDILYWDVEVLELFERPLPGVHRNLGPLSVSTALKTLMGPAFYLIVDPVHRLLGFGLNPVIEPLGFGSAEEPGEAEEVD